MAKPVLLIVDEGEATLRQIQRDLERGYAQRYRVLAASSGREALKTLRQLKDDNEQVALIVANQHLPEMSGIQFLERAKTLFPNAGRALLTTFDNTEAAIEAVGKFHIDDFLIKPCQPAEQRLYPVLNDLLADWETRVSPPVEGLRVVGSRFSPQSHQTRDFLVRNCVPFEWLDVERDEEARRLLGRPDEKSSRLPIVVFPDGTQLIQPTNEEIAQKIGLKVRPEGAFYDLVIVGGG